MGGGYEAPRAGAGAGLDAECRGLDGEVWALEMARLHRPADTACTESGGSIAPLDAALSSETEAAAMVADVEPESTATVMVKQADR